MTIPIANDKDIPDADVDFDQARDPEPEIEDDGFITVHVSPPLGASPKPEEPR